MALKNDPYGIWNFEKPIRFGRLAKGSSWGETAIFQTRLNWRHKLPGACGSCDPNFSTIISARLQGSQKKMFSSKRSGGAEIRPLEEDRFWQKKCIFSIVDLTEFGAARIQR